MADDKDVKNEQELNKQREEGIGYLDQARKLAALLTSENRAISEELREQLGIRQRQNDFDKALLKISRQITQSSEQNAVALGRSGDLAKAMLKDQLTLQDALREAEITRIGLAPKQVGIAKQLVDKNQQALDIQDKIEEIQKKIISAKGEEKKLLEDNLKKQLTVQSSLEQDVATAHELLSAEGQKYALSLQLANQAAKNVNVKKLEEVVQNRINASMGVTGSLIKSAKGAMDQLGMGSLGNLLNIDKANTELKEQIDLIERAAEVNGQIEINGKKMSKTMAITSAKAGVFKNMLQGAFKSATSLESTLAFTLKSLLAGSDTQAKFQKMTGMSATAAYGVKTEMAAIANLSGSNFITSEKLVKTYAMMSEQLGMAASAFSGDTLVDVTYMTEKLHLSAEAATQLATMSELNGKSSKKTNKELGKQLSTFNKQNKTMFSLKDLMNDIGTASKAMVLTLGKSPKLLMKAASEARKLGTNLSGVQKISDSLLDFETSIEKQMEAQLITGKQLNLSAAREAALRGDMATVAKEVAGQEAIREAFATNNVIAQQAAAEAIGLSREELADMTYQQELLSLGADKFKDKYGDVAYENLKAQGAQDKFNDAMVKMQSILGDIIGAFSPIIDIFAKLMSFPLTPYIMAAVVASKALGMNFGGMFKSLGGITDKLKSVGKGLLGMVTPAADAGADLAGKAKDTVTDTVTGGITDKAADALETPEPKASGQKIHEFFKGLSAGLKEMASMEVVKGALALIPAAIGLTAMIPGTLGAKLMENLNGGKLSEALTGMASGLTEMSSGKVFLGALALVAAGVGFTAMTLGAIGMAAVAFLGVPAAAGLKALSKGLLLFGTAAMNPLTWAGIGLLAALGVALIPLGFAIGLVAPAIAAFGAVIQGALGGVATIITAISDGFVNLLGAISIEKAAAVGMMGLGLVGLAAGTVALGLSIPFLLPAAFAIWGLSKALGAFEGMDLTKSLGPLAELAKGAPGLLILGPALIGMSIGVIALAAASTLMPLAAAGLLMLGGAIYAFSQIPLDGFGKLGEALGSLGSSASGILLLGPALMGLSVGVIAMAMAAPFMPLAAGGIIILGAALNAIGTLPLETIGAGLQSISNAIPGFLLIGPAMASAAVGLVALGLAAPFIFPASLALLGLGYALARVAPMMETAQPAIEALANIGNSLSKVGKGMMSIGVGVAAMGAGAALLAVFGPIAAIGVTAFAAGLLAAGVLVIPAIPGLLAMAGAMYVLAPAMKMLAENGGGLIQAAAGLLLLGPAFISVAAGALVLTAAIPALAGAALGLTILAGGMAVMNQVNPAALAESLKQFADVGPGLVIAGQGLMGMAAGMIAFSAASGIMALSSISIWLALAPLATLAAMSTPLASTADSLTSIGNALAMIKESLSGIETEKLNELQGLVMTTAFAAPMVAASGAISGLINGITGGGGEGKSDTVVAEKLDLILAAIKEGGDVIIDGNKVGESLMLASAKSS